MHTNRILTFSFAALLGVWGLNAGSHPAHATEVIQKPKIEAVFVLDTTGSMSGLIQAAKEKIWAIANTLGQAKPTPEVRIGIVAYRDRGDAYITKVTQQTADLDSMYKELMTLQADGGGDGPESVNEALNSAITKFNWSTDDQTYRVVFLVGDAPPHMDYKNDVPYKTSLSLAKEKKIFVNTIQCGSDGSVTPIWNEIAQLGSGTFSQVAQDGAAVRAATPYDDKLAALSREMDRTKLAWGSAAEQKVAEDRAVQADAIATTAAKPALASRAVFNASAAGAANFASEKELVADVAKGKVKLESVPASELPAELRSVPMEERVAEVNRRAERRQEIEKEIAKLAKDRQDYLEKEAKKHAGKGDTLDERLFKSMEGQAKNAGYDLGSGPKY